MPFTEEGRANTKQCKAKSKISGERCKKPAVKGFDVCTTHGAGSRKRVEAGLRKDVRTPNLVNGKTSKYFKQEILQKIEDFRKDKDLEKLDFEIAYLKTLPTRIEEVEMHETDKIMLLEKVLTSIFNNMDKREKVIESRRYSIGVEKLQLLIKYMFASVQKHVSDPEVLSKIAKELRELASKTNNTDDLKMLEGKND